MAGRKTQHDLQRELSFVQRRQDIRRCRVGDAYAKLMIRTLDDRIGDGHSWEMTFADLAGEMECSLATAYRAAKHLRKLSLLSYTRMSGGRHRFILARANLADFIPEPSGDQRPERGRRPAGETQSSRAETEGAEGCDSSSVRQNTLSHRRTVSSHRQTTLSDRRNLRLTEKRTSYKRTAHLSAQIATTPLPPSEGEWVVVVEKLIAYGVTDWQTPCSLARSREVPPREVLAIIAHAEGHQVTLPNGRVLRAWNGGALRRRVVNACPGQDPAIGWMAPCREYLAARRSAAAATTRESKPDPKLEAERAKRDADRVRLAELEQAHGERLDALSREELDELLAGLSAFERRLFQRGGVPAVRTRLLEQLASRDHGSGNGRADAAGVVGRPAAGHEVPPSAFPIAPR